MNKSIQTLMMTIALSTTTILASGGHAHDAHGGHSHHHAPVSEEKIKEKALSMVDSFVKKNVIDKSWASSKIDTMEKKVVHGNEEWIIILKNTTLKDKTKEKLYVFLTLSGRYIAANHTGK